MTEHITHRIIDFPDGAQSFFEIPFEVGPDVARIEVSYDFSSGSTIDLGLAHKGRLRGWTGSEYAHVFVTQDAASAGYHPGPLAGSWQVVLGAVKLAPDCSVDIDIRLIPRRPVWLAGELHSHTEHSDGGVSVSQAVERARGSGCDFLALTDHNTTSQNQMRPDAPGLRLIPGLELTTYWGHTNFLGLADPVSDARCGTEVEVARKMAEAHEAGATIVVNHPRSTAGFNWWQPGWDVPFDALEIWNGTWAPHNEDAVALWQELLEHGRRIPCTGGSDFHLKNKRRHGRPCNRLFAQSDSVADILAAVRAGTGVVTSTPDEVMLTPLTGAPGFGEIAAPGAKLAFEVTGLAEGAEIHAICGDGTRHITTAGAMTMTYETTLTCAFTRFEIWSNGMPQLFSNPVYAG